MPHLSWNEVRDRAIRFSREHQNDRSESAEKQTFWNDFFHVFGLRRASLASFEANVTNLKGHQGAIDLLWRGKLLVEHKSFGQDLTLAETQAFTYIEDLTRAQQWQDIPRYVLVSDFARFVLYGPRTCMPSTILYLGCPLAQTPSSHSMPIKTYKEEEPLTLLAVEPYGKVHVVDERGPVQLHYDAPGGQLFRGDTLEWLASLPPESVDLCFADPPYNIRKAQWDTFESHDHYVAWSRQWIELAARALKPTGTLYVCGFSEVLADIKVAAMPSFRACRWLVWHYKNKANLGSDWGRSHESILHLRKDAEFTMNIEAVRIPYSAHTLKYPQHPQALTSQYGQGKERSEDWQPNPAGAKPKDVLDIPTTCNGMGEKTPHPTQKPEELLRKLVLASSDVGDLVIDPFSGSGTTCVVAQQLRRRWMGCDANPEYNQWAIKRLNAVPQRPIESWIALDKSNAGRRESIR